MAKFNWDNVDLDALKEEYRLARTEDGKTNREILPVLCEKYGVDSVPRLRGKLMIEKVYVKDTEAEKETAPKKEKKARVTKAVLAAKVAEELGLEGDIVDDIAKLKKATLETLIEKLTG